MQPSGCGPAEAPLSINTSLVAWQFEPLSTNAADSINSGITIVSG